MTLSNLMNKSEKPNSCKLRLINITANLSARMVHRIKISILCHEHLSTLACVCVCVCEPGSSVGIATDYELDGLGSNSGGDEIFRPSKPALGPTQPPLKWVPCLSRG